VIIRRVIASLVLASLVASLAGCGSATSTTLPANVGQPNENDKNEKKERRGPPPPPPIEPAKK
jgi:predicted small lipoprotein YifL